MPAWASDRVEALSPFVPRVVHEWLDDEPDRRWRAVDATVVFVDVSGFTRLSERLARRGRIGAEELTEVIGSCFSHLLAVAYAEGGGLLKFGGDALLILFSGPDHATRGCRAAVGMRARLREVGRVETPGGGVRLRMSVGVHSGEFLLFLVGASHRELVITGPAATQTVIMEGTADAGEIVVSPATAALLPASSLGETKGAGVLLRRTPGRADEPSGLEVARTRSDLSVAIPYALRDHLLAGGDDPEHRVASVAFVHFDEVDELAINEGPAALAEALDGLMSDAAAASEEHGVTFLGTDVDRDGGKIILAAGVPRATGQDEERLLRAVRRIVDTKRRLPVRIGVNRGHVFAGEIGPSYRRTYTVMGDTVNLAARLMAAAPPEQILATAGVLEQARSLFATEALPPFMVKGKSRPVQAYSVGAPRLVAATALAVTIPFVGRAEELEVANQAVSAAREGSGSVVEIRGDPGIGKSRLVDEIRRAADDLATAHVTCVPYETADPYWVYREMLHRLLDVNAEAGPADIERILRDHVSRLAPELEPWLPLLATPLQLSLPDTPETAALEPRFRKQLVEERSVSFLGRLLREPTLIVLEDAHWADEASADILRVVERSISAGPWIVCSTRSDDPGGFQVSIESSRVLRLGPLTDVEAQALVLQTSEDHPLRPHDVDLLTERAGGNPRFLVALVREAIAAGGAAGLPDSIDSLVSAQIDRLPADLRRELRHAAVLGNAFDDHLLGAVVEGDAQLVARELEQAGLLLSDGPGRIRFRHALLRDVAYEGVAYKTRQILHQRVGEALERSGNPDEDAALLSLHFFHGGRYDAASRYARAAGDRARDAYANVEAAGLYERAFTAARRSADANPIEMAAVSESLGDAREVLGVYDLARDAYRSARKLRPDDPVFEAQLCLKEAWIGERLGQYSLAVRWTRRGLRRLEGIDTPVANGARARLTVFCASMRQAQGQHREAVRLCQIAIDLARTADDRDALAHSYYVLDWAYTDLGRTDLAVQSPNALALYEELGDLAGQAVVANNMGGVAYYEGRWDDAVALYEKGREGRLRTGDSVEAARGTANIAEILLEQSRFDEAETLLHEARRVFAAASYRGGVAFTTAMLGRLAARLGDFDLAISRLDEARELYVSIGGGFEVLQVDGYLADVLVLRGAGAEALVIADATIIDVRHGGDLGVLGPSLLRTRGYALAQTGDRAGARAALGESLDLARAERLEYEMALTYDALARLDRLDGTEPEPELEREAAEIFRRLGVPGVPLVPFV